MRIRAIGFIVAMVLVSACATDLIGDMAASQKLEAARNIVAAVNAKNSEQYVRDLAADVVVAMYAGDVRLRGRDAVKANREAHFQNFPQARNALVHLVEIDDRVIMHDQVWLSDAQAAPADIVEVFTFSDGEIVRIEVIQSNALFSR